MGYGRLSGSSSGPNGSVDWSGGAFGAMVGMGAEFCFTDSHCLNLEKKLKIFTHRKKLGVFKIGTPSGFDTVTSDGELEKTLWMLKRLLSGLQGSIGYQFILVLNGSVYHCFYIYGIECFKIKVTSRMTTRNFILLNLFLFLFTDTSGRPQPARWILTSKPDPSVGGFTNLIGKVWYKLKALMFSCKIQQSQCLI